MSTVKTIPPTDEAPTPSATTDRPELRHRRLPRLTSPWVALGAVLVVGGAIAFAVYALADRPDAQGGGEQASGNLPGRIGPGPGIAVYDSQVPAAARRAAKCAVVGYGAGSSLIDSQVPAQGRPGAGCTVVGFGAGASLYDSQVPVQARDHVAACVALGYGPGGSVIDSQVPVLARRTSCVVVSYGPGGSLYDSQVPSAARTE